MRKLIIFILFFSILNFTFAQQDMQVTVQIPCPELNLLPGMIFPFGGMILSVRTHCNCFTFNLQRIYVRQLSSLINCKDYSSKSYMALFSPPLTKFYKSYRPRSGAQTVGLATPMIPFPLCFRKKSLIPCIIPVTADNLVLMFGVSMSQINF